MKVKILKLLAAPLFILASALVISSCGSIIGKEYLIVTDHTDDFIELAPDSNIQQVRNYTGMKNAIENLVSSAIDHGVIRTNDYTGSAQDDVSRACQEIIRESPKGVYAVEYISFNPIRSYYEIELFITYKRSIDEINSIIEVNTASAFYERLDAALDSYDRSITLQLSSSAISEKAIGEYVEARYRDNPQKMVELPALTVNAYPSMESVSKIISIEFRYSASQNVLSRRTLQLSDAAELFKSDGDSSALLALDICRRITERVNLRANGAGVSRTAFGALVTGYANSEGCAMAFKLLCDIARIECYVLEGRMNREPHFWNIIKIDGYYYHVDSFMCGVEGMEVAFLKRDSDMLGSYWWDIVGKKVCDGPLDYNSLLPELSPEPESNPEEADSTETVQSEVFD